MLGDWDLAERAHVGGSVSVRMEREAEWAGRACGIHTTWATHLAGFPATLLKAHLANIRSTSGLPKLDPFSLYVGGIGKRRGE